MLLSRLALVLHLATAAAVAEPLRFSLPEGGMQNEFYRDGPVAAHVVLRPGPEPRVVVAFPAGNSGAALWFDAEGGPFAWKPDVAIEPASRAVEGGTLRGDQRRAARRGRRHYGPRCGHGQHPRDPRGR